MVFLMWFWPIGLASTEHTHVVGTRRDEDHLIVHWLLKNHRLHSTILALIRGASKDVESGNVQKDDGIQSLMQSKMII